MALLFIERLDASIRSAFETKVKDIASFLSVNPDWLMMVMYAESKLNPQAQNIQSGRLIASGILQFTTASGFNPAAVLRYSALQQLDFVKQYFLPYKGRMKSYFDVYLVVFFPAAIGKPDNYILQTSGLSAGLIAKQNPAVNINKDGQITLSEFKQYVKNTIPFSAQAAVLSPFSLSSFAVMIGFLFLFYKIFI